MDTEERVRHAIELLGRDSAGLTTEFNTYLQELKNEDRLAFLVIEVLMLVLKHE
ncbi:MAG: hypothetical protein ABIN58_04650 [candidate division WOR-3 bacterium]